MEGRKEGGRKSSGEVGGKILGRGGGKRKENTAVCSNRSSSWAQLVHVHSQTSIFLAKRKFPMRSSAL